SGADDGHGGAAQRLDPAARPQHRRRIGDRGERWGIRRVVPGNGGDAAVGGTLHGRLRAFGELDALLGLAAPVFLQQPVEYDGAAIAVAQPLGGVEPTPRWE